MLERAFTMMADIESLKCLLSSLRYIGHGAYFIFYLFISSKDRVHTQASYHDKDASPRINGSGCQITRASPWRNKPAIGNQQEQVF